MDESRKAFEREYWNEFGQFEDVIREEVFQFIDFEYYRLGTRMAWWAWQASREAIEIKLPTENELHQKVCSGCASESLEMVERAIRAAGIKVKE